MIPRIGAFLLLLCALASAPGTAGSGVPGEGAGPDSGPVPGLFSGAPPAVEAWIERVAVAERAGTLPRALRFTAKVRLLEPPAGVEAPLLTWELALDRAGSGGTTRSSQSGRTRLTPGQTAVLSSTAVGPQPGRCNVHLRVFLDSVLVAEDVADCGEGDWL